MLCKCLLVASILATLVSSVGNAQDQKPAYAFYTSDGHQETFNEVLEDLQKADVILFGEHHNNPIDHWMQLEIAQSLHNSQNLVIGAEMFETDDQLIIEEYLSDQIAEAQLKKEAKVWPNFETDYSPILRFAKENNIPFIATNVPRRYASMVARSGQSSLLELDDEAKGLFPRIPFVVTKDDRGYQEMVTMMEGHGMNIDFLIEAQALKDYTMATRIIENRSEEKTFLHLNGAFHSKNGEGICNYIRQLNPALSVVVITAVEGNPSEFDSKWNGQGDHILVTPLNMTKTH